MAIHSHPSTPRFLHRSLALAGMAIAATAVEAAVIHVDGVDCTLTNAITAANTDTAVRGCAAGSGADTILLHSDVVLTAVDNDSDGPNGLPSVTTMITIMGRNHAIERSGVADSPAFRLLHIGAAGDLTLDALRLQNGLATSGFKGGALFNLGALKLTRSIVSGNRATLGSSFESAGGGLYNGGVLTLSHSTVSDNLAEGGTFSPEGLSQGAGAGGGLYNEGTATLVHSSVSGNEAHGFNGINEGGGIYNQGAVTLTHSTVSRNSASGSDGGSGLGGGIYGGTVTLTHSTISENGAGANLRGGAEGGGILAETVTLDQSTVSGNKVLGSVSGGRGGGISAGTVTLIDSTISGNSAGGGGGISAGTVVLTNSTVSNNNANMLGGGGISAGTLVLTHGTVSANSALPRSEGFPGGGGLLFGTGTLTNSLVADNTGGDCVFDWFSADGTVTTAGLNLIEDGSCGSGFPANTDPNLGPLMANGGPTQTQALLTGSPAIDQIAFLPGIGCEAAPVTTDQRGVSRPQPPGGRCDIGAFEQAQAPAIRIGQIIEFIDLWIQRGMIGLDESTRQRLGALRSQLVVAADAIAEHELATACGQLTATLEHIPDHGRLQPGASAQLMQLMQNVREGLPCSNAG